MRRLGRDSGIERGEDGVGEHRERQQEERERDLERDHPALDVVGEHERHRDQDLVQREERGGPQAGLAQTAHLRVHEVPAGAEPQPRPADRHQGDDRHAQHAQGGAHRQHRLLRARDAQPGRTLLASGVPLHREYDHGRRHHQVVGHRGERGRREPPPTVQHRGRDCTDRVEHHLRQEEDEEERAQAHLVVAYTVIADRDGERAHHPRAGHEAHRRHETEADQGDAQQRTGHVLGLLVASLVEEPHEGGHEHRREQARGEQLEEDVGDQVRRLVGVPEKGGAERGADRDHAHEAREARRHVPCGDHRRRTQEALAHGSGAGGGSSRCACGPTPKCPAGVVAG